MVIVRVQYLHNIPGKVLLLHSLAVVAFVERIKLEAINRFRVPDTQRIHNAVAITDDRQVIGNRPYYLIALLFEITSAVLVHIYIDISAKFHFLGVFRSSQFKRIAVPQPVIRHFNLISVPDFLLEHTITVTDATAISGIPQSRQGIQETCCKTSQPAVTKGCVGFLVFHHININTHFLQRLFHRFIRLQIDNIIAKRTAHQKLHGKVIYHLRVLLVILFLCRKPLVYDRILDCIGFCSCSK